MAVVVATDDAAAVGSVRRALESNVTVTGGQAGQAGVVVLHYEDEAGEARRAWRVSGEPYPSHGPSRIRVMGRAVSESWAEP